jgi:hypothetical protein
MHGPVGLRCSSRISDRVVGATTSTLFPNASPLPQQRDGISRPGESKHGQERTGGEPSRWLPVQNLSSSKGHRPIINLKKLNEFIPHHHFKMEGIHMLQDLLKQGDFMAKIHLKDAYFAVPISK